MRGKSPHTNITATKHPLFCCHIRLHVHFMSIYFCLFWETLHRFYRCASEWAWFERNWSETSNGGGSDSIILLLHYWLTTCKISWIKWTLWSMWFCDQTWKAESETSFAKNWSSRIHFKFYLNNIYV